MHCITQHVHILASLIPRQLSVTCSTDKQHHQHKYIYIHICIHIYAVHLLEGAFLEQDVWRGIEEHVGRHWTTPFKPHTPESDSTCPTHEQIIKIVWNQVWEGFASDCSSTEVLCLHGYVAASHNPNTASQSVNTICQPDGHVLQVIIWANARCIAGGVAKGTVDGHARCVWHWHSSWMRQMDRWIIKCYDKKIDS